jgi:hypothetical protein
MDTRTIDTEIRNRIQELSQELDADKDIEYGGRRTDLEYERDQLLGHYLPFVANTYIWFPVGDYVAELCDSGGGADGRPGRLYSLEDWEIIEAETWFRENKNWKEILGDNNWDGDGERKPGAMVTINKETNPVSVPVSVVYYVSAAFSV